MNFVKPNLIVSKQFWRLGVDCPNSKQKFYAILELAFKEEAVILPPFKDKWIRVNFIFGLLWHFIINYDSHSMTKWDEILFQNGHIFNYKLRQFKYQMWQLL